jgi:hypothetical protein
MYSLKKARRLANTLINVSGTAYGVNPSNTPFLKTKKEGVDIPVSFMTTTSLEADADELTESVGLYDIVEFLNSNWTGFIVTVLPASDANKMLLLKMGSRIKGANEKPLLMFTNVMKHRGELLKETVSRDYPYADKTATKLKVTKVF